MEHSRAVADGYEALLLEVDEYLELLAGLETATAAGSPRIVGGGESGPPSQSISGRQQRMMYSSLYVQLYNLVEATVTLCLDQICLAVTMSGDVAPLDLDPLLREEWIRYAARTHDGKMNEESRLKATLWFFGHVASGAKIDRLKIVGPAENWDDDSIVTVTKRFGLGFSVSRETRTMVKRDRGNGLGALQYVRHLRNLLAHGSRSFSECSEGIVVFDLKQLRDAVVAFLDELVGSARRYLENRSFLDPKRRPVVLALPAGSSPSTNGGF